MDMHSYNASFEVVVTTSSDLHAICGNSNLTANFHCTYIPKKFAKHSSSRKLLICNCSVLFLQCMPAFTSDK